MVTPIFSWKNTTFFAHHCHFYWFHSGVTPWRVSPHTFLPVRPRLSTIHCKFTHIFSFGYHPLEGVTRGGPPVTKDVGRGSGGVSWVKSGECAGCELLSGGECLSVEVSRWAELTFVWCGDIRSDSNAGDYANCVAVMICDTTVNTHKDWQPLNDYSLGSTSWAKKNKDSLKQTLIPPQSSFTRWEKEGRGRGEKRRQEDKAVSLFPIFAPTWRQLTFLAYSVN